MSKPNLSDIYRNGTRRRETVTLDADDIVALAGGQMYADDEIAEQVAASSLHRDLIRFAADLESDSSALVADVAAAHSGRLAHRRSASQRAAHGQRRWRFAAAAAAALVAVVAVWTTQRADHGARMAHVAQTLPDHIFAGLDNRSVADSTRASDEIFRSEFRPDVIFRADNNGG